METKHLLGTLVSLLLVLPVLLVSVPTASAATSRALTITNSSASPAVPFKNFDGSPAKVFDFNGDGKQEIIAQNDNQYVYVFDSKTGAILFQVKTNFPAGWGARSLNGPEVTVVQDGTKPRLILANSAAVITSYQFEPGSSTNARFAFIKLWERRLTDCYSNPGMDSKPVLADLDKDGRLEILANTEERGIYALRHDGAVYWKNCLGGGNSEPSVGDLNQDGYLDVVQTSDNGWINALNGRTGGWLWSFNLLSRFNLGSGSIPVGAGIGQLDGVGGPDVVVGARDSHDSVNFANDHAILVALSSGGGLLWAKQDPTGNPLTYTHPIVVDAQHDGRNEVYWADWNTIGHKPPWDSAEAWKRTGPANFYRYDHAGNLVWKQSLDTYWNNKDLAIADVDGDGVQEVLANGPGSNGDGIWYLDTRTGAKEAWVSVAPYAVSRGPIVSDLWKTGTMQWVVEAGPVILVYNTNVRYSSVWPHLPYVSRTAGTGGANPVPTTTSVSSGSFAASFVVPSNVNEWWVETKVDANQPLSRVDARTNGGAWTSLPKTSWGTWAKSYHVPRGSIVEFRATSGSGATVISPKFTWLGTASAFSATFSVPSGANNWWVEVAVASNQEVVRVDASVNNGAWTSLPKTSWGTWAKSFYVADGSTVTFRATNGAGQSVTSGGFRWS